MIKLAERWEKTDKNRIMEILYLVVLGLYLLKLSLDTTMFYTPWPEDYEVIIFILTCGVVMLKIGYSQKCQGLRWLFCVIMGIVFGLSWWHTEYNYLFLLYIPVLITGAIDVDYKKILKISFWINFGTLALAFWGSCAGAILDLSYEAEEGYRHSFGIVYTTDFAARVFYLLVIGWVLFENVNIIVSLLSAAFFTWFIYYYCQGKCGVITLILFMAAMIYEYAARNGKLLKKIPIRVIDKLITWSAPICALCIFFLSFIYDESIGWISRINNILTNRLMLANRAIDNYGFTFLGTAFEQRGAGGRTAYSLLYNFIDSSYVLIVLRYGCIVFFILLALMVYQSRIALKNNQRKLLLAIMLVAVHSIVEHHLPEVNYNIFLILPFSAVKLLPSDERVKASAKIKGLKLKIWLPILAAVVMLLLTAPMMISYIRTLVHLLEYYEYGNNIYFILWSLIIAAAIIIFIYTMVKIIVSRAHIKIGVSKVIGLAMPIIVIFAVIINSGKILQKGMDEYTITINREKQIIEKIIEACGGDITLYVEDVPSLYKRQIASVSDKLLPIETCDMTDKGVVLIIPIEKESDNLLGSGYYFGELSDIHGVYTNDKRAISTLEAMGVGMTDYYSVLNEVDMQAMADANGLDMSDDGGLLLSGSEKSIYHGPWIILTQGKYIIEFDLELLNYTDNYQGFARITTNNGETLWTKRDITVENFDENGHGVISFEVNFWCDIENTEFILIANDGTEIKVNSIDFRKVSN